MNAIITARKHKQVNNWEVIPEIISWVQFRVWLQLINQLNWRGSRSIKKTYKTGKDLFLLFWKAVIPMLLSFTGVAPVTCQLKNLHNLLNPTRSDFLSVLRLNKLYVQTYLHMYLDQPNHEEQPKHNRSFNSDSLAESESAHLSGTTWTCNLRCLIR